ncbi:GreA/GreB family elongation factor [Glaciibacter psychrotolerans]|uniref:Transcription elongation factor GreA n=1 Tax=Glaciibacter psychrotolerans TaxID=670054 RepID=A0A7Z0EGY0_9MICO|nr:GreA/GreB family elongation factor [Leifsonia psychrotolerans]NYJ21461.1 transcription elongation factor GreA [Leifsonia psychrotolerans]
MSNIHETVWMTPEVLGRLRQELDELTAARSSGLVAGDRTDSRIREIEQLLRGAEVGSKPDDGLVEPGMKVTVRFQADGTSQTFLIGARELLASDPSISLDVYSPSSPLGAAIVGKFPGDEAAYTAPNGSVVGVQIVSSEPFAR